MQLLGKVGMQVRAGHGCQQGCVVEQARVAPCTAAGVDPVTSVTVGLIAVAARISDKVASSSFVNGTCCSVAQAATHTCAYCCTGPGPGLCMCI